MFYDYGSVLLVFWIFINDLSLLGSQRLLLTAGQTRDCLCFINDNDKITKKKEDHCVDVSMICSIRCYEQHCPTNLAITDQWIRAEGDVCSDGDGYVVISQITRSPFL